ncbi:MAG: competence type IV pilus major pilin ComGC [Vulcanimicrobiota bacterium]
MGIKRAFANIEFMIVIAIFAILAATLVPNFLRARIEGQARACTGNAKNFAIAAEMYAGDNDGLYPPNLQRLVGPYLKALPTCPASGQVTYEYQTTIAPDRYTVFCSGSNHPLLDDGFPRAGSQRGVQKRP